MFAGKKMGRIFDAEVDHGNASYNISASSCMCFVHRNTVLNCAILLFSWMSQNCLCYTSRATDVWIKRWFFNYLMVFHSLSFRFREFVFECDWRDKKKGKVFCVYTMKACRRRIGMAPFILNFGTRWM
jgi:hypothetical protein